MKSNPNTGNKEHRQFLLTLILSLISILIGTIQLVDYKISTKFMGLFLIASTTFSVLYYYISNIYHLKKYSIFEKIIKLEPKKIQNAIVSEKITEPDRACLNRFDIDYSEDELYWPSSWLGALDSDIVDNIIIEDDKENNDFKGKIPIETVFIEGKKKIGLRLKFVHNKGGWWTAVLHGRFGKPSSKIWSRNSLNVSNVNYLSFFGKSNKEHLYLYLRFEDIKGNSSNGVIIEIDDKWKIYKIPISKFFISRDLAYDVNYYLKEIISLNKSDFDTTKVQQIDFGCSETMESQEGEVFLCDIKFQ